MTGTPDMISRICRSFRVYWSKADEVEGDEDDYQVDHSVILYLIGPDGKLRELFTQAVPQSKVIEKISGIITEEQQD